jgi:hypothetical protein
VACLEEHTRLVRSIVVDHNAGTAVFTGAPVVCRTVRIRRTAAAAVGF